MLLMVVEVGQSLLIEVNGELVRVEVMSSRVPGQVDIGVEASDSVRVNKSELVCRDEPWKVQEFKEYLIRKRQDQLPPT